MVYFQNKNSKLGRLLKALEWNFPIYFMTIWYFEAIWCIHLPFWYILFHSGLIYQKNLATLVEPLFIFSPTIKNFPTPIVNDDCEIMAESMRKHSGSKLLFIC
jgi:hypothetical protein